MVGAVVVEFAPVAQGELLRVWDVGFVLDVLEIEVLREADLVHLTLVSALMEIRVYYS